MAYISSVNTVEGNSYDIKSKLTSAIPYGECDSTSTATAFTATVTGITSLYDGVCVMLKNGVITSASGFTIDINGLGAKPVYNNMATGNDITPTAPTRDTTIFNINYTMLLTYSESIVEGGGWICYRGYDSNSNTIGYQLRTNSTLRKAADKGYRYRLWFQTLDGTYAPANLSTSTNATATRTPNPRTIDPFGEIIYYSTNDTTAANANLTATTCWQQYVLGLGYSFNSTGAALVLTYPAPVYVKATPQTGGGVKMDGYVQTLPSTADGKVYIYLGMAYSATNIELVPYLPVYYYADGAIRLWTNPAASGSVVSVTQVVTSGTKIATVTVDNVGTDLYTPTYSALTTSEIEDAVDAAFPVTLYEISFTFSDAGKAYDPSDTSFATPITSAPEGATVYVHNATAIASILSNPSVTFTKIDNYTYSYFMPGSAITITVVTL